MDLFQELSVLWNALTGEIVKPKRKYIEELFNTLDVDQDETITFHEYALCYVAIDCSSIRNWSFLDGFSILIRSSIINKFPRMNSRRLERSYGRN